MSRTSRLQSNWAARARSWHEHVSNSTGFTEILDALWSVADAQPSDQVIDLGAGSGFVSLKFAPSVRGVLAVDLSSEMLALLEAEAQRCGQRNVVTRQADLATFDVPAASCDLVVSNYALHHLPDARKAELVKRVLGWLRPGGRIVIADMMFGRGATASDRVIIRAKVRALLRKGPGGVWRIVKNAVRFGLRRGTELPATPEFWVRILEEAGFQSVRFKRLVSEAGLVYGVVPTPSE